MKLNITTNSIIFILLFGITTAGCSHQKKEQNQSKAESAIIPLNSNSIIGWTVRRNGDPGLDIKIFKDSGIYWQIKLPDGRAADAGPKTIQRCLHHLTAMEQQKAVNLDQSKWQQEGIGDSGIHLIINGKQNSDTFIVGKMEFLNNKSSYYFRRPHSSKVYLVIGAYLDGSILAPVENYRKSDMVPVDVHYIKKAKIVAPNSNVYYFLENLQGKWTINGQDVNQDKANEYLKMLTLIHCPSFAETPPATREDASVTIETIYGNVKLEARQIAGGKWIVSSSVNVGNYLAINAAQAKAIFPVMDFFQK